MIPEQAQSVYSSPRSGHAVHRIDIDGLRALAVAAVVLFHADLLPAGYVGVDIFFVISGYLMALIVHRDMTAGRFSLLDFYARRARRIIPALVAVMAIIALAGSLFMLPHDIKDLGRSLIAASTFTSNMWFRDIAADYFAAENVLYQPMLHSWSLAVEAQFYVLFPFLLLAAGRWLKNNYQAVLMLLAVVSLGYSSAAVENDPQAAFYLLSSRMWELLAGALVYFLPLAARGRLALMALGAAYLAFTLAFYHPEIGFPGWKALLPVLGTALLLYARPGMADGDTIMRAILSARPVGFLAAISYSLYLWHWPLFVFARYNMGSDLPVWLDLGIIAASILLAWLSWRWVEQPFLRAGKKLSARRKLAVPLAMLAALIVTGIIVKNIVPKHMDSLLPPEIVALADAERDHVRGDCAPGGKDEAFPCRFGRDHVVPSVLVWGNSFARMWLPGLDALARERGLGGMAAIRSACGPASRIAPQAACDAFNDAVLQQAVTQESIGTVVLLANWTVHEDFAPKLEAIVKPLRAAGKAVYFVLYPPMPGYAVPRALALAALRGGEMPEGVDRADHERRRDELVRALQPLIDQYGLRLIDPADVLCGADTCPVQDADGMVIYYDRAHITARAAREYRHVFAPVFMH